jgi:hypothetical protein
MADDFKGQLILGVLALASIVAITLMVLKLLHPPAPADQPGVCHKGQFVRVGGAKGNEDVSALLAGMRQRGDIVEATRNAALLQPQPPANEAVFDASTSSFGYCRCVAPTGRVVGYGQFCENDSTPAACARVYDAGGAHTTTVPEHDALPYVSGQLPAQGDAPTCACKGGYGWTLDSSRLSCLPLPGGLCRTEDERVQPCPGAQPNNDAGDFQHCCCRDCPVGCMNAAGDRCDGCPANALCAARDLVLAQEFTYSPLQRAGEDCACPKGFITVDPQQPFWAPDVFVVNDDGEPWTSSSGDSSPQLRCWANTQLSGHAAAPCVRGIAWNAERDDYECACDCKGEQDPFSWDAQAKQCCKGACPKSSCLSDAELAQQSASFKDTYCGTRCLDSERAPPCLGPDCCPQCRVVQAGGYSLCELK